MLLAELTLPVNTRALLNNMCSCETVTPHTHTGYHSKDMFLLGQPGKLVHRLHISSGVWEKVPSLRTATTKAGVCVLDGQIFVGGGWNGSDLQCSFEKYGCHEPTESGNTGPL